MTPQAHIAALKALHVAVGIESNKLAGVLSTVKVPDDAAAKASISGVLKDALSKPPESWNNLDDGAEAEDELEALLRRKEAMDLLVESIFHAVRTEIAGQVEVTKLEAAATLNAVKAKFDEHQRTLELLHKEAPALIASANIAKNRALKVTGATGLSEPEALKKYETARAAILKSHRQMITAIAKHDELQEKLTGMWEGPDGKPFTFPPDTEREDRKAMREDAKDMENVQKTKQLEIYSAHGVSGSVVGEAKDTHKAFDVPKHLKSGDYEKLKRVFRKWVSDPAVVKAYPLLLHELEYMYDAVDPIKAMHLMPPNLMKGYTELLNVSKEFKQERELQNKALYEELLDVSSQDIKDWLPQIHSAGQDGKLKVEVEEGDGVSFMYCLLAAHVKFTSSDQNTHMTTLMGMKALFAPGRVSTLQSVERARAMLKEAKEVGVMLTYNLCGMQAIKSMAEIDSVRDLLREEKLMEPEVLSHPSFNQMDCTRILQTALTVTHGAITERIKLDDSKHKGTRKAKEAGAEITAMKTEKAEDKKAKRKRKELVQEAAAKYELDEYQTQSIRSSIGQMSEDFDSKSPKQQKLQIEARALTLSNGQTLSEPIVRANLKHLQKGGKGGKVGGKGGKGGKAGTKGGKGGKGRGGRGGTCMIKNCGQETKINSATDRPFALCSDCNDKSKQGKTLYKIDGSEWRTSARVDAREADVSGSDGASSSTVSMWVTDPRDGSRSKQECDKATLAFMARIKEQDLQVDDGSTRNDPMDDLDRALGRR